MKNLIISVLFCSVSQVFAGDYLPIDRSRLELNAIFSKWSDQFYKLGQYGKIETVKFKEHRIVNGFLRSIYIVLSSDGKDNEICQVANVEWRPNSSGTLEEPYFLGFSKCTKESNE